MSLLPLTAAGVADKITELYALPDIMLTIEADAIALDFRLWLFANFDVTLDQKKFLEDMNNKAVTSYGLLCGLCFLYRLDITLVYDPVLSTVSRSKWVEEENKVKINADGAGNMEVTGSIKFTVVYRM